MLKEQKAQSEPDSTNLELRGPSLLVVHIGPHKTASTYIQNNLYLTRGKLEQAGWVYPEVGCLEDRAHHHLAHNQSEYLQPSGKQHNSLATLPARLSADARNLVFSAEGFCRWKPRSFGELTDLLKDQDLHLVYVVRDPLKRFYSHWSEEVKQGYTVSLPARVNENFKDPSRSRLLNPFVDLNPIVRVDKMRMHVVLYDSIQRLKQDIFKVFLQEVLGVNSIEPVRTGLSNPAYSIELTEFLRLMTVRRANGKRHIGSSLRHAFIRSTSEAERDEIAQSVRVLAPSARRTITLPRDSLFYERLDKQIRARLAPFLVPRIDETDALFPNDKEVWHYYDEKVLQSDARIVELLNMYMRKIEERLV